jgi:hypothetical protein
MRPMWEIRADFDVTSIVVYQAFSPAIAEPAVLNQRFVPPFSFGRMTWIKPSFLWLMERSNWGQKANQERILAVRITRAGWEAALAQAVLTSPSRRLYPSNSAWRAAFAEAPVHVQWDPERTIRAGTLPYRSIQVGLSRHVIRTYVEEWIVSITDYTDRVRKIHASKQSGHYDRARRLLPPERVYPLPEAVATRIGMSG